MITLKASARKSKGKFKPLLEDSNGKTRVLEQSPERFDRYTKHGVILGNLFARGAVYSTRAEAVAAAQRYMDRCFDDAYTRYLKAKNLGRNTKYIAAELVMWAGNHSVLLTEHA